MGRGIFVIMAAAMLLASGVAFADTVDEKTVSFGVTAVPSLVSVTTNADPRNVLPGMEYKYDVNVSWAVPAESITALQADHVKLYVNLLPEKGTDSYFISAGRKSRELYLTLLCNVKDGACSPGSILHREASFVYINSAGIDQEGTFTARASLSPFADAQTVSDVDDWISDLSARPLSADSQATLEDALAASEDGDYARAAEDLKLVEASAPLPAASPQAGFLGATLSQLSSARLPQVSLNLGDSTKPIAVFIAVILVLGAIGFAAFKATRRPGRRRGIDGLDDYEVRGRDYREEPVTPPEHVEYRQPQAPAEDKPEEDSIVKRVPDWLS